jgi:ABC-type amino acid transport substrate-binding protein
VLQREPEPPRSYNRTLPRDLETICLKALAKEASRRYRSAGEMADDLMRYLSGQAIQARPVSRAERVWRWCRRNPVIGGLAGAVVVLLGFLAVLLIKTGPGQAHDDSLARIQAAGKVAIVVDPDYPPMGFLKDGKVAGFDIDLARELARRLGVRPGFQVQRWSWPDVPTALRAGTCDLVIASWTITEERKQEAAFVEYLRLGQVFVCRKGMRVVSEQDLAGKILVVVAGTVGDQYARTLQKNGLPLKEVKVIRGNADPFPLLRAGRADVTITDEPVGRYYAKQDPTLAVTGQIGHAMDPNPVGIVCRQQDHEVQQAVADALRAMKADGTFARLLDKWFGK